MLIRLTQPTTPPGVGASCLRKTFSRHGCTACVDTCPVNAIALSSAGPEINPEECVHCGHCLFVCPVDALQHLRPANRHYKGSAFVAPLSALPPSVDELLMWHYQSPVRAVEMEIESHPGWARAVAALNIRLRERGEPAWAIRPPEPKAVNLERRRFLRTRDEDVQSGSVAFGHKIRRQASGNQPGHHPSLDVSTCVLCGACARACPEGAIRLADGAFELSSAACSGCKSCEAVCPVAAISVERQSGDNAPQRFACHETSCRGCQRKFYTFNPAADRCPVCERHPYGMREA